MADFDPLREPKPLNRFWWNLAWLTTSGTPPHTTTLVTVAQLGWSGQMCDFSHLWLSFLFSFFRFLHRAPRSHFLTDRNDLYAITRVSGQRCAFWGFDNRPIRLQLRALTKKCKIRSRGREEVSILGRELLKHMLIKAYRSNSNLLSFVKFM